MSDDTQFHVIARIHSDFPSKFGIPRQSGLAASPRAALVFAPEYRNPDALRGLEGFSHLWLIWEFSQSIRSGWSPTVRPPRLGGNTRMGVFATRSPFRPNPIGLSCVKLEGIRSDSELGPVIWVSGADLLDGTPILDLKPYLPYTDAHPDASEGFTAGCRDNRLSVDCHPALLDQLPAAQQQALLEVLSLDPRPSYQNDPHRVYGMEYSSFEVKFTVSGTRLTVLSVEERKL